MALCIVRFYAYSLCTVTGRPSWQEGDSPEKSEGKNVQRPWGRIKLGRKRRPVGVRGAIGQWVKWEEMRLERC